MTDVKESFVEHKGAIDLKGFPRFRVLEVLNSNLKYLCEIKEEDKVYSNPRYRFIRFDNSYIDERQQVMKKLEEKNDFNHGGRYSSGNAYRHRAVSDFKSTSKLRSGLSQINRSKISADEFEMICKKYQDLHRLSESFLAGAHNLSMDVTYQRFMQEYPETLNKFDGLIAKINKLDDVNCFYINLGENSVTLVSKDDIPDNLTLSVELTGKSDKDLFKAKHFGKRKLHRIHDESKQSQRKNVLDPLKHELESEGPTIKNMHSLSKPYVVFESYKSYINSLYIERDEWDDDFSIRLSDKKFVYPKFSYYFNLKNLFPLTANDGWEPGVRILPQGLVNIDFNTRKKRSKNLFVGLNSGGKSFFLEAMTTTMLVANMGLPIPADKAILPRYNKLIYYNNSSRESFGKLETEMNDVARIIDKAKEDDMIVIDNFFEGGTPQVTTNVSARYMEALTDIPATVFIESHAPLDLDYFESQGWGIFSPGYTEKNGKYEPNFIIEKAKPDQDIVTKFAIQLADKHMSDLTKKRLAKRRRRAT